MKKPPNVPLWGYLGAVFTALKKPPLLVGLALAGTLAAGIAWAVHDLGLFELDGNTLNDPGVGGDDWENVYNGNSSAFATNFTPDSFANDTVTGFEQRTPEVSFFTGGGSKDTNGIQSGPWQYDTINNQVPDKDDIENAFAAAYDAPNRDTIFYFGADRYDAGEGSADIGFWFFRKPISLGTKNAQGKGPFVGEHTDGDIFVDVNFDNGGNATNVKVYKWVGNDATGSLVEQTLPTGQTSYDCSAAGLPTNDVVCATANKQALPGEPPWPYKDLDGPTNYQPLAFFEGGINISYFFPNQEIGCFSSFMARTLSSGSSQQAQLKDFALGTFPVCGIDVTKTGDRLSKAGDSASFSITIKNTGRATLYKKSIVDSVKGDLTTASGCNVSLAPHEECTITYTLAINGSTADPLENTVSIEYCETGVNPTTGCIGASFTDNSTWTTNIFQPDFSLAKTCAPSQLLQGGSVNYDVKLTGNSSADTPNLDCSITDPDVGLSNTGISLTPRGTNSVSKSYTFGASMPTWCTPNGDPTSPTSWTCKNQASATCSLGEPYPNKWTKPADCTVTVIPRELALSVSKSCDQYSKVGDPANYVITVKNETTGIPLTLDSVTDSLLGELLTSNPYVTSNGCSVNGGVLQPGASCTILATRTVQAGDEAAYGDPLPNQVRATAHDAQNTSAQSELDSCSVDLLHPALKVTKECRPTTTPILPGDYITWRIDTTNLGDADLNISINDSNGLVGTEYLGVQPTPPTTCSYDTPTGSDSASDGCYRVEYSQQVFADTTNVVTVTGTLPAEKYGTLTLNGLPNEYTKEAQATCDVQEGGPTRTWGFWKTHGSDGNLFTTLEPESLRYGYTCYVANTEFGCPIGDDAEGAMSCIDLGWKQLYDCGDVFGIFWDSKAQCDSLTKTRLQASRQYLAAMLNYAAFGTLIPANCIKPADAGKTTQQLFDAMKEALSGTNTKRINELASTFACYNESGDDFGMVTSVPVPHADPNGTRAEADPVSCKQ